MDLTIVGLGEVLWDILPDGKQLGGAPANFAYHCHALTAGKAKCLLVSAIGYDDPGKEIISHLDTLKLSTEHLYISRQHPTGSVSVTLDAKGIPDYNIKQNVAWDFIPEISLPNLSSINAICFGSLAQRSETSANSINRFLSSVPENSIKVFDVNLRQCFFNREIIESSLKQATVLKINDTELKIICNLLKIFGNEQQQIKTLTQTYQLNLCALTKGALGSILYDNQHFSIHSGFKIDPVDTVGAGDAFTAAITLSLLKGLSLDEMNIYANKLASYVCTTTGATPDTPSTLI